MIKIDMSRIHRIMFASLQLYLLLTYDRNIRLEHTTGTYDRNIRLEHTTENTFFMTSNLTLCLWSHDPNGEWSDIATKMCVYI